jgi:hypothetical protein
MVNVTLSDIDWSFNKQTSTILISERDVPFATTYNVISPNTGVGKLFELSHSTGPEFDPKTCWIYKSEDGLSLSVANDAKMVEVASRNYLRAKLGK